MRIYIKIECEIDIIPIITKISDRFDFTTELDVKWLFVRICYRNK